MTDKYWNKIIISFLMYIGKSLVPIVLKNLATVWNDFCQEYDKKNIKELDKQIIKAMEGDN